METLKLLVFFIMFFIWPPSILFQRRHINAYFWTVDFSWLGKYLIPLQENIILNRYYHEWLEMLH